MQLAEPESAQLCEARQTLSRVGDKWSIAVIYALGHTTKRFTELRREINGISQRMLTATLRTLERDGLVSRTVHPVVPPRVDYALTELGVTLLGTVCTLMRWAIDHADDMARARAEYDARPDGQPVGPPLSAPAHQR
ncbi:winged helix-turn-helix transcriptional regulator [Actinophytocola sediminis]